MRLILMSTTFPTAANRSFREEGQEHAVRFGVRQVVRKDGPAEHLLTMSQLRQSDGISKLWLKALNTGVCASGIVVMTRETFEDTPQCDSEFR